MARGLFAMVGLILLIVVIAFMRANVAPVQQVVLKPQSPQRAAPAPAPARRAQVLPRAPSPNAPRDQTSSAVIFPQRPIARNVRRSPPGVPRRADRTRAPSEEEMARTYTLGGDRNEYQRPYDTSDVIAEPPYVMVFSKPPGMMVFLNGVPAGNTPLLRRIRAGTERMRIRLEAPQYETVDKTVEANDQGHIRLGVNMKPIPK